MSTPFLGEIRLSGFNFAPQGWAICDGSILAISEWSALFTLIGTTYGGNGTSTFAIPDLRGRIPIFQDGTNVLGQQLGTETVTLTAAQIPNHTHTLLVQGAVGTTNVPTGNYLAEAPLGLGNVYGPYDGTAMQMNALANEGGSQPHNNLAPFVTVNFIIALFGIYPSQS